MIYYGGIIEPSVPEYLLFTWRCSQWVRTDTTFCSAKSKKRTQGCCRSGGYTLFEQETIVLVVSVGEAKSRSRSSPLSLSLVGLQA